MSRPTLPAPVGASAAARAHPLLRLAVPLLSLAALALLAAGVILPLLRIDRLWLFSDTVSLWQAITALFDAGETFLAVVLTLFSIVFPAAKLGLLAVTWTLLPVDGRAFRLALGALDTLGKWSMMDVLVTALLILSLKAQGLANAASAPGVYCFAAAVVLSMAAGGLVRRAATGSAATTAAPPASSPPPPPGDAP